MKKHLSLLIALSLCTSIWAQNKQLDYKPNILIKQADVAEKIRLQEESAKDKQGPNWFGVVQNTDLDFANFKQENDLKSGVNRYIIAVEAEEAKSLNYQFTKIKLPTDAQILIKDYKKNLLHKIEAKSLAKTNFHNTFPILGNKQFLVLEIPSENTTDFSLKLSKVTYGYKAGNAACSGSGACNIDASTVSTPTIDNTKNSIGMIIVANSGYCTGTLINNPKEDGKPYFLTANHCLPGFGDISNWSVGFKYYSCTGATADIPTIIDGATLVANNFETDFALIELSTTPTLASNVYYSGWDRSDIVPSNDTYGVHHPNGAPMKISTNSNPLAKTTYQEQAFGEIVWGLDWEEGTTEGGSSGSGLFSANGSLVGTLVGGAASCGNPTGKDYYGRIAIGFNNSPANGNLQPWLNPGYNTNTTIDGYNPNIAKTGFDLFVSEISNIDPIICDDNISPNFKVYNNGALNSSTGDIKIYIDGNLINTLNISALAPANELSFSVGNQVIADGDHVLELIVNAPGDNNNTNDTSRYEFSTRPNGLIHNLNITLDDYGSETKWEVLDSQNNLVAQGGPYNDNLGGTSFTVPLCLNEGCYTFNFIDTYGDGLCCDTPGEYELLNQFGAVVAEGWNLPDNSGTSETESTTFCASPDGIAEHDVNNYYKLYPNPNNGTFTLSNAIEIQTAKVFSYDGKLIKEVNVTEATVHLNLAPGVYKLVLFTLQNKAYFKTLVIAK